MRIPDHEQRHLNRNVFGWNEQELSLNFISPLITLVNFSTENTHFFAGREFEGVVNGEPMRGKPDGDAQPLLRKPHVRNHPE